MVHRERHRTDRIGWLRAAVLGANDGIVSTASLVVGVAAANAARGDVLVAGVAGLVAGALSMAAGEYVSVSSQSDTEQADLALERAELGTAPEAELKSSPASTSRAASTPNSRARWQAVDGAGRPRRPRARRARHVGGARRRARCRRRVASAATFAVGAGVPLVASVLAPRVGLVAARRRRVAGLPRRARRAGRRTGGASLGSAPRGRLLGSPRDGRHRRRRPPLRRRGLRPGRSGAHRQS